MSDQEKGHDAKGDAHGGGHKKHKKHHHGAHPEHEHEEGWIVSFADNVLLMMGFFVILLAMNMGPKGTSDAEPGQSGQDRLLDFAIAVRAAFNSPVSLSSTRPEDQALIRRLRQQMGDGHMPIEGPSGRGSEPQTVRPSEWLGRDGFVQFDVNKATLDISARRTIEQVSAKAAGSTWIVEIRGHASRWESWGDPRKARDLSYERAFAVGQELVKSGLKWEQLRLVSSGDAAPVVAGARSADEAVTNQRAEILILNETVPADPFKVKVETE